MANPVSLANAPMEKWDSERLRKVIAALEKSMPDSPAARKAKEILRKRGEE